MKYPLFLLILFLPLISFSQTNTEVFLCDIESVYGGLDVFNIQNISNDPGYDNQPSFADNDHLYFAGNNKGQTDIVMYSIAKKNKKWFHLPTEGGEYSPQFIPNTSRIAAVRLDSDGLQRLYSYSKGNSTSSELVEGVPVAYFAFYNESKLLASVLSDDSLDLVISDLKTKITDTLLQNSGRSIHKVPDSKSMSYTLVNEDKNQDLYLFDMTSRESFFVCELPVGIEDYEWLNSSQILIGSGAKLYIYDTFLNSEWEMVADLSTENFKDITRLAVSPDGTKLSFVAEPIEK